MNKHLWSSISALLLIGVLSLMNAGCGSLPRQERSAQVADTAEALELLLHKSIRQNYALQKSVKILAYAQADKLLSSYDEFESHARLLRSIADEVKRTSREMNDRTEYYFKRWQDDLEEIWNSDLKNKGLKRRDALMQKFAGIAQSMAQLERAYQAYERDLDDVEKFLGNDLTSVGLQMARPHLKKVSANSPAIKDATRAVLDGMDEIKNLLNPQGTGILAP